MNVTICQCSDATNSASTNARAVMYRPSRLPVPAPSRIVAYMQAKASSMPIIQNQIGILPSKYCTAISSSSPAALTMIDRWSGTRRYSTAIYTMQAAHSQIAVYERGISGSALVIGVIDSAESTVIVVEDTKGAFANPASIFGNTAPITCHPPYSRSVRSGTPSCVGGSRAAAHRSTSRNLGRQRPSHA